MSVPRLAVQLGLTVALFAVVALFANWPTYRQIPPGSAVVMLSFVHGADRRAECRRLTPEEIAKLPANMKRTEECPRRRRPIDTELEIDGEARFRASLPPSGIAGDGPSRVYERFVLPAGTHLITVRMRDTPRTDGFDHIRTERVSLAPDQLMVIDYNPLDATFIFR